MTSFSYFSFSIKPHCGQGVSNGSGNETLAPPPKRLTCADCSFSFKRFLVGRTQVNSFGKIKNRLVRFLFTCLHNGIHRSRSYTFHCTNTKSYCPIFVYREFVMRLIDIWPQHLQSHTFTLLHEKGHLLDIVHIVGQYSGHVFGWIVRFEVSCLISYPSITSGV